MKKILTILISFAALLVAGSCSKDFIDKTKPYSLTSETVFSSPELIEANLLGCYYVFKSSNPTFMGGRAVVVADSRGEDMINISNPQTLSDTYNMAVIGTTLENNEIWAYAYYAINYSNVFADNLIKYNCVEILGQQKYDQFLAEARFIRAYSYYVLCQLYSEPYCINPDALAVPLRLTGLESSGNNNCPESTIAQVYNQILADCMPDKLPADAAVAGDKDAITRASAAAAHLLRMRVYMAMQNWDAAITEGEAITGFELADDVASLYGKTEVNVAASGEMIFALPSTTKDKPNTQMSCAEYYHPNAQVSWIDEENGIAAKEGYFLAEDARVSKLVSEADGNGYRYSLKYMDYGGHLDWVPLMRYAEVVLNLAECYANKTDGTATAKSLLSQVRRRSLDAEDDAIDIESMSGGAVKTAVYDERRLEFLAEGLRGFDIIRRGESFVKNNAFVSINVAPGAKGYTWPIPDQEKSYNKEIKKK